MLQKQDCSQQQTIECDLSQLLAKKNLDSLLFDKVPSFDSPIEVHAAWAFENIYSKSYKNDKSEESSSENKEKTSAKIHDIARLNHGMSHICRAAIALPIWINLFRRYKDEDALSLTQDEIKLLQLAMLFHDAARENDGKDLWDHESATFLYHYLITMGIEIYQAAALAEAVCNKDADNSYYRLNIKGNEIVWIKLETTQEKNIYQKVIHDADCLDIIRVRDHFDARFLDFYKQFISKNTNDNALNEIALLICEWRSIIRKHGDTHCAIQIDIKKQLEEKDGFLKSLNIVKNGDYFLAQFLYNDGLLLENEALEKELLPQSQAFDSKKGLEESNVQAAMKEGKILARGLSLAPSALNAKPITDEGNSIDISMALFDIKKAARRKGIATTSSKENRLEKHGFPVRSTSFLYAGASLFAPVGFLIMEPEDSKISSISIVDKATGWGKKQSFFKKERPSIEKIKLQREQLLKDLKLGGNSSSNDIGSDFPYTYNECTYDIEKFDAIYYTLDPTLAKAMITDSPEPAHPYSPLIQAIFIQKEYESIHNKKLPIFEYSGLHNYIKQIPETEYTDEKIKRMWLKIIADHLDFLSQGRYLNLIYDFDNLDNIKINAIYNIYDVSAFKPQEDVMVKSFLPPDSNYSKDLKKEINELIINEINQYLLRLSDPSNLKLYRSWRPIIYLARGEIGEFYKCIKQTMFIELSSLLLAAKRGNKYIGILKTLHTLRENTKKSFSLDVVDNIGNSPLSYACEYGHLETAKQLLQMEFNVNHANNELFTPLHFAVMHEDGLLVEELIEILLNNGAAINAGAKLEKVKFKNQVLKCIQENKKLSSYTPLDSAVTSKSTAAVKILLSKGAKLNFYEGVLHRLENENDYIEIVNLIRTHEKEEAQSVAFTL